MKVTEHSKKRGKERLGLNNKAFEKTALKALENGITHKEVKGKLNRYLNAEYLKHKKANAMRIYNEFIYFFQGSTLITVIPLPNCYKKYLIKLKVKKITPTL